MMVILKKIQTVHVKRMIQTFVDPFNDNHDHNDTNATKNAHDHNVTKNVSNKLVRKNDREKCKFPLY